MSNIQLHHEHKLGLKKARKVALDWVKTAEKKLSLTCDYEEGKAFDTVRFERAGVTGTLYVRQDEFEIQAKLGFLLSAFKERIESEIKQTLESGLKN